MYPTFKYILAVTEVLFQTLQETAKWSEFPFDLPPLLLFGARRWVDVIGQLLDVVPGIIMLHDEGLQMEEC